MYWNHSSGFLANPEELAKHQKDKTSATARQSSCPRLVFTFDLASPAPLSVLSISPASQVLLHIVLPDVAITLYSYIYYYGLLPLLVHYYYVQLVCLQQFSVCMSLEFSWGAVIQLHFCCSCRSLENSPPELSFEEEKPWCLEPGESFKC